MDKSISRHFIANIECDIWIPDSGNLEQDEKDANLLAHFFIMKMPRSRLNSVVYVENKNEDNKVKSI
jgi:hypothetical protein